MQPFAIINTCNSTFIILGSLYCWMMPEFFIKYMYIMCYNGLLHYLMSYMYMYVLLHVIGLIQQLSFEIHIHNNILQPPTFSCCSLIKLNRYSKLLGVTPLKSCWKFSTSSDGPTVWMYNCKMMYTNRINYWNADMIPQRYIYIFIKINLIFGF